MFSTALYLPYFTTVRNVYINSVGVTQVAQPNPSRTAIYFTAVSNIQMDLDYAASPPGGVPAFVLTGPNTLKFYWQLDGILTTEAWYLTPPQTFNSLVVTEIIWQPPTGSYL